MYLTIIFFLSHRPFVLALLVESLLAHYLLLKIIAILKRNVAKYTFL